MNKLLSIIQLSYQKFILWVTAIACFFAGLGVAIEHTFSILATNNYALAPLGDGAHDAAVFTYPILLGQEPFSDIYKPFADHRVVIERLWAMFDFVFTNGTQASLPLRLAVVLWLVALLIIVFIVLRHKLLTASTKLLITGVALAVIFSGISLINYNETMLMSWPFILLFSLSTFICLDRYCHAFNNHLTIRHFYQCLTIFFICLSFLTFNVWMLLWPVVFIVLFKNHCLKFPSVIIWLIVALLTYKLYFSGHWHMHGSEGLENFLHHPANAYLYLSRILSIPLIDNAMTVASLPTIIIAFAILSVSILWLLQLMQRPYNSAENILFAFFLYFFIAIIVIAVARFWMEIEAVAIGLRFTTPSGMITIAMIMTAFIFVSEIDSSKQFFTAALSIIVMVWLIAFYNSGQKGRMFAWSGLNQWHMLISTGVQINNTLANQMKDCLHNYDVNNLNYLVSVQQSHKKGAFSLWPTQNIGKTISSLNYQNVDCSLHANILIDRDLRPEQVPGMFFTVSTPHQSPVMAKWDILFSNQNKQIIGYGITAADVGKPLIDYLKPVNKQLHRWAGVINTDLLYGSREVTVWAASDAQKQYCKLGEIASDKVATDTTRQNIIKCNTDISRCNGLSK